MTAKQLSAITDIKERRLAFLSDTVRFYTLKNRNTNEVGKCIYEPTRRSKGCAIGRFAPTTYGSKMDVDAPGLFAALPAWMQAMGAEFLYPVQSLHDNSGYWTNYGLSSLGHQRVVEIMKDYTI